MFRTALALTAAIVIFTGLPLTQSHIPRAYAATETNPWAGATDRSLVDAIKAFEKFSGGKVLEIRFRNRHGTAGFDAVIAKGDVISNLSLDVGSDVVAVAEIEVPQWMVDWKLRKYQESLAKAKIALTDAVLKAEQIDRGPAVDAGLAKHLTADNAVLAYNVELIKGGKPDRVVTDAVTGQVIANPEPLLDAWTPEKELYESLRNLAHD
jgi:hypothetical protein